MAASPRPEPSRSAILHAAVEEFAEQGEDGARMEAIARAAGVNKALLHYYFGNKEGLYAAALDWVLAGMLERQLAILQGPGSAGRRILRHLLSNFQGMASLPVYARLMGHEMVRARQGQSARLPRMVEDYFRPLVAVLTAVLEEGMAQGEFRPLDPTQTLLSLMGANVFYFHAAPIFRVVSGRDPREPEFLAARRPHLVDLATAFLFRDPEEGARIAADVLAETERPRP
jgi:TetR/AcrR family transcriptional regulator